MEQILISLKVVSFINTYGWRSWHKIVHIDNKLTMLYVMHNQTTGELVLSVEGSDSGFYITKVSLATKMVLVYVENKQIKNIKKLNNDHSIVFKSVEMYGFYEIGFCRFKRKDDLMQYLDRNYSYNQCKMIVGHGYRFIYIIDDDSRELKPLAWWVRFADYNIRSLMSDLDYFTRENKINYEFKQAV
jgi:hypothetical protein